MLPHDKMEELMGQWLIKRTQGTVNNTERDEYYMRSREQFRQTVTKDAIWHGYNTHRDNVDDYLYELIFYMYDALDDDRVKEDIEWFFKEILQLDNMLYENVNNRKGVVNQKQ